MNKLLTIIFVFVFLILIKNMFSSQTYKLSALEIDRNFKRQDYLGIGLNKIYKNRFGLYYFNKFYPKMQKLETAFLSDFSHAYFFVPIFGIVIYSGYKKFNEK